MSRHWRTLDHRQGSRTDGLQEPVCVLCRLPCTHIARGRDHGLDIDGPRPQQHQQGDAVIAVLGKVCDNDRRSWALLMFDQHAIAFSRRLIFSIEARNKDYSSQ